MARKRRVELGGRLGELAGNSPERAPNVRTLARYAANSACSLAALGFAARVDFDKLLVGTAYEVPFGQSPFAFLRGNLFEEQLRKDNHSRLRALLAPALKLPPEALTVENLRGKTPEQRFRMSDRAEATRQVMAGIVKGKKEAPNVLDGAVLTRTIGGVPAYFEADAVAAHGRAEILAGEVKSFPTVDGQADPEKVGAAVSQVAIYLLLLGDLVESLGGDRAKVSSDAFLITPKNTGLVPTLLPLPVGRETDRARRILEAAPDTAEIVASLPEKLPTFADVAHAPSIAQRLEAASCLAEEVGTHYAPSCLSSCGLSRFCRERAYRAGDPARIGGTLVRLLPGVASLDRAGELARGAEPSSEEAPVAAQLVRAASLLDEVCPPAAPRKRRSQRPAPRRKP